MTCHIIKTKMLSQYVRGGIFLLVEEGGRLMVMQKFHV